MLCNSLGIVVPRSPEGLRSGAKVRETASALALRHASPKGVTSFVGMSSVSVSNVASEQCQTVQKLPLHLEGQQVRQPRDASSMSPMNSNLKIVVSSSHSTAAPGVEGPFTTRESRPGAPAPNTNIGSQREDDRQARHSMPEIRGTKAQFQPIHTVAGAGAGAISTDLKVLEPTAGKGIAERSHANLGKLRNKLLLKVQSLPMMPFATTTTTRPAGTEESQMNAKNKHKYKHKHKYESKAKPKNKIEIARDDLVAWIKECKTIALRE
jgi:hypothetical protein